MVADAEEIKAGLLGHPGVPLHIPDLGLAAFQSEAKQNALPIAHDEHCTSRTLFVNLSCWRRPTPGSGARFRQVMMP
jgi:hypothetical protein